MQALSDFSCTADRIRDMGTSFKFSLRAIPTIATAGAYAAIFASPRTLLTYLLLVGLALLFPSFFAVGALNSRGSRQAFYAGAFFPAFAAMLFFVTEHLRFVQTNIHYHLQAGQFPRQAISDPILALLWLMIPLSGLASAAFCWLFASKPPPDKGTK
ncbi:MAG TPA: hypothetical protein PK867_26885 [Pirellulales bacterium]|nr:hypothetical protein [Pirellulales bacterium]